jgi:hypothetical protein
VVKLTLTHDELDEKDEKFFAGISQGWPAVLSNLKSLLEGGRPLVLKQAKIPISAKLSSPGR